MIKEFIPEAGNQKEFFLYLLVAIIGLILSIVGFLVVKEADEDHDSEKDD